MKWPPRAMAMSAAARTCFWPRTRTLSTTWPSRTAASYQAKSGAWSAQLNSMSRHTRPRSPRRRPLASTAAASSAPSKRSIVERSNPAVASAFAAASASARVSKTANSRPTAVPIVRVIGPAGPYAAGASAGVDERLDLADEPLERFDVVRGRLLGDRGGEAHLGVGREPLGQRLRRAVL